jgi:hypothetical protein
MEAPKLMHVPLIIQVDHQYKNDFCPSACVARRHAASVELTSYQGSSQQEAKQHLPHGD